jgi:hypothetical protein
MSLKEFNITFSNYDIAIAVTPSRPGYRAACVEADVVLTWQYVA